MKLTTSIEHWAYERPFRITGHTFDGSDVLVATVEHDGLRGRGEAAGVYYRGETAATMAVEVSQVDQARVALGRHELLKLMPAGGARNAIDCALWELESLQSGHPVWRLAGIPEIRPLITTYTLGADAPRAMAERALQFPTARALKLKLVGDGADAERVSGVRTERPDVWLGVDANQGFTQDSLDALMPTLVEAGVKLIEQPFPLDCDHWLDGLRSPIPVAADESVQHRGDIEALAGRVNVINIKLDKCGGLTEALAMVALARRLGLKVMVGNMMGTSLSTAPGFLLGQLCDLVDLDGPLILASDRTPAVVYADGHISCPAEVWGATANEPVLD